MGNWGGCLVTTQGGISIRMSVKGIDELHRRARRPETIARPVRTYLRRSGLAVQRGGAQEAPVDQGRLRADIKIELDRRPLPRWVKIGPKVGYAIFQELGTGIYGPRRRRIRPRQARALRWMGAGGQVHFAMSVKGVPATHFMSNGLRRAMPQIRRERRKLARNIARRLAHGR